MRHPESLMASRLFGIHQHEQNPTRLRAAIGRLLDHDIARRPRAQSGAHVLSHQSGLLVLKDVAMIHERVVARCRLIESDEKLRFVLNKHHVLPAR